MIALALLGTLLALTFTLLALWNLGAVLQACTISTDRRGGTVGRVG